MVPIPHFLYLAFGLFVIGLLGAARSRARPVTALLGVELMLCGVHLAFVTFSRAWGQHDGLVDALAIGVLGAAHALVGGALCVAARAREPAEKDMSSRSSADA